MKRLIFSVMTLIAAGIVDANAETLKFDIVVSGGSFGAPGAALAAARNSPQSKILLIEPTDWLGGQSTSQGVSAIDNSWFDPGASLMRNNPPDYYAADYLNWLNRMKNLPPEAPGTGLGPNGTSWVSRESFDPRTGAWALDKMMEEFPNITVLKMTVVKKVDTVNITDAYGPAKNITRLELIQRTAKNGYKPFSKFLSQEIDDWFSSIDSADFIKSVKVIEANNPAKGLVVIDASETGDAIVLSGADYVVGREKTTEEVADDGTIPEHNEAASQATVYPFCMTDAPSPQAENELKAPWADFDSFYSLEKSRYYKLNGYTYNRIWTYRRLKVNGTPGQNDTVNKGDVSMQNWYPGNDYPYGSIYLTKAQTAAQLTDWHGGLSNEHLAGAEKEAIGWYFFMKENKTHAWDTHYLHGDDAMNMMGTEHGLSKFPYIRCGRRIMGLQNFRLLQRTLFPAVVGEYSRTSYRFYDSVAIGNYALDSHAVTGSSGVAVTAGEKVAPFYLPYRAIASSNVRNLLAGGKSFAGTYWTNSAYRLHPIEWAVGSAAGVAAVMMHDESKSNMDLLKLTDLRRMQTTIAQNSPIHWKTYDQTSIPAKNGDLVLNGFASILYNTAFKVEVYQFETAKVELYFNNIKVGESNQRVNDRFIFKNLSFGEPELTITAKCYDSAGNLITELNASDYVIGVPDDLSVVDNDDSSPRFELSPNSGWTRAASQPDKYGNSYHYADGNGGLKKAIWRFQVPIAGDYKVQVWYPASSNRAVDAPFKVNHKDGSTVVKVNQRVNGGSWQQIGSFPFNTGEMTVELSNEISTPTNLVLADAVRIQPNFASVTQWETY